MKKATRKIRQSPKLPAEKRQEQLLSAAKGLFLRKGYRATTMEDIAARAGLTKGAVYFHFESKEDIFFELIKVITEKHDGDLLRSLGSRMTPTELFRHFVKHHGGRGCPDFQDMAELWVQALRVPRIRRYVSQRTRFLLDHARNALDPASARSGKELADVVTFVVSFYHGLAVQKMMVPSRVNLDRQTGILASLFDRKGTGRKQR